MPGSQPGVQLRLRQAQKGVGVLRGGDGVRILRTAVHEPAVGGLNPHEEVGVRDAVVRNQDVDVRLIALQNIVRGVVDAGLPPDQAAGLAAQGFASDPFGQLSEGAAVGEGVSVLDREALGEGAALSVNICDVDS